MTELERLAKEIMAECEKDGEPVTLEEATEMAKMELGEKKIKRYEKADTPKKEKKPKERKVDETKKHLLACCETLLEGLGANVTAVKTETEISFTYNDESYTFKLTKHRPKK